MRKLTLAALLVGYIALSPAWAFEPFIIKNIRVKGVQKVSKDAVLQELPIRAGDRLQSKDTAEIIRTLFKTGFFKDVQLSKEGQTLIITVIERPSIASLRLHGIKSQDKVIKILNDHGIAEGRMLDPTRLKTAEQEIEHHFLSKGHYGVRIETLTKEEERNRIAVDISIFVGNEARIKQVRIVGNQAFSEKTLQKQMLHGKSNLLSWYTKNDLYAKEKLEADLEILRSYYMDRGYINFQIDSTQVSLSPDKKDLYLTINVTEGDLYRFGKVTLSGTFVVDKAMLEKGLAKTVQTGDVFSRKKLWDNKKDIEELYGMQGYSKANVRINFVEDKENKSIDVDFFIEPSKRITVRSIHYSGNNLTQDEVLRRGNHQMEGTWISTAAVNDGKEFMLRNAYAKKVDVETFDVPGVDDQVDILYRMEEARTAQLSAGIAYSAADRLMFNAGADMKNFMGTGRDINFNFNHSKSYTTYSLGYWNPYFTKDGVGIGYNLYYNRSNLSQVSHIFDYTNNNLGGDISFGIPLSPYDSLSMSVGMDHSKLSFPWDGVTDPALAATSRAMAPVQILQFINQEGSEYYEYHIAASWKHNTLDRYMFPTRGTRNSLTGRVSLPVSTLKYYQLHYQHSWFKPITGDHIINLNGMIGYGNSYGDTTRLPFFKNYYLGGADSVRGFQSRSLGPRDSTNNVFGGNLSVFGNVTYIFPAPLTRDIDSVRTGLFFDAGQVYDSKVANPHGLRYSVGFSITWNTPLGVPLIMTAAKPLNRKANDRQRVFDFTFGTQFF